MKTIIGIFLGIGVVALGGFFYLKYASAEGASNFRTATIKRDELLPTISATGTLEPEETIDIGAQVTGLIKDLGPDPTTPTKRVDYGSHVEQGAILAKIDPTVYEAQVAQAKASWQRAQADLVQMKAKLVQAQANLARAKHLIGTSAIAQADYEAAVADEAVAQANVKVGEAAIVQAKAALDMSETNLGYTVAKSPVKGVVVDRRVNIGQTVVSSMNASSLFLLAKDLSRLQVWASVNEADIGRIHKGQTVRFTVDAFPNETFYGQVIQIRLNATMTSNVIMYTVVVETDNSKMKLLPYLTANVQFEMEHHKDVLVVPNAALRWKPRSTQIAPEYREASQEILSGKGGRGKGKKSKEDKNTTKSPGEPKAVAEEKPKPEVKHVPAGKPEGEAKPDARAKTLAAMQGAAETKTEKQAKDGVKSGKSRQGGKATEEHAHIWIKEGDFVRPLDVRIIATDGTLTEVAGKDVKEDMEVVVGENVATDDSGDATNPFAPKFFGKKR